MKSKADFRTSISILFVEDDEVILEIQSSILSVKYPDVMLYTAVNGRSGLELFKAHTPDIVLTDINMPEMCGVQMSCTIHAIKPDTKFVAITGITGESGENGKTILRNPDGNTLEFDHVIVKPVDVTKLYAAIEQCIGEIGYGVS
jgi:YesN/AraC family two-component response regulator